MTDTLSDKIVEAGALPIALHTGCEDAEAFRACVPELCTCRIAARARLTAALAAAEAEGVVLCVVPGAPPFKNGVYGNGYMDGATDFRAFTLAGKVTL
jgi:hypothetical protein